MVYVHLYCKYPHMYIKVDKRDRVGNTLLTLVSYRTPPPPPSPWWKWCGTAGGRRPLLLSGNGVVLLADGDPSSLVEMVEMVKMVWYSWPTETRPP